MEPLVDPGSLPLTLAAAELAADTTVVGLLPPQATAADEVAVLERRHIGIGDADRSSRHGIEQHSVQGTFVGVEREEGAGSIRFGRVLFEYERGPMSVHAQLLDGG